jgi:hypothetical protein
VITMTGLEWLAIGAEPLEHPPTRRDTAAAEPIPAGNPTTTTTTGQRRAAAAPTSRSFVLAALRALHLDVGFPAACSNTNYAPNLRLDATKPAATAPNHHS